MHPSLILDAFETSQDLILFILFFFVKCTFKKPGAPPDGMAKREVVTLCRSWGPEKQDKFREWGNTCKGNGSGTDRRPSLHVGHCEMQRKERGWKITTHF